MVLFNRVYSMLKRTKFTHKNYRKSIHTDCDKCIEKIKLQKRTDIYEILLYISLIANGFLGIINTMNTEINKKYNQ
jgi:hypothetical protein